jgi:hypothetical protein
MTPLIAVRRIRRESSPSLVHQVLLMDEQAAGNRQRSPVAIQKALRQMTDLGPIVPRNLQPVIIASMDLGHATTKLSLINSVDGLG